MKLAYTLISTLSLLAALSIGNVYADDHKHEGHKHEAEGHEEHGAHEHGVATLSIAAGESGLEIMLESPAANIVGFEHAASSDEDKQKLADTKAKLEAGADLFSFNPEAECTLKSAEVVSALLGNAEAEKEDHDHEHKDGDKEEHAEHEHEEGETHSDMDVTWSFACAKPAELKEVTTKLFAAFPEGFRKLKAEWVTDKGASAQELDKDATLTLN